MSTNLSSQHAWPTTNNSRSGFDMPINIIFFDVILVSEL
jgi:hypothetical protein